MAKAELLFIASENGIITLSNPGGIGRWLKAGHSLQGHHIRGVWCHPHDPTHVICGDGNQLWQSHDGAQSWHDLAGPACQRFFASRTTPTRILASTTAHAWLSHDAGATWHQLGSAYTAGMAGETLWYDHMRSIDGGQTWHAYPAILHAVSHDGVASLTQHGDTWFADDTHAIAPPPHMCHAWALCSGAPWSIVGADGVALWHYQQNWTQTPIAAHIVHTAIYHPDQVWAASRHGQVWLSTDRGTSWLDIRQGLSPITALASARLI